MIKWSQIKGYENLYEVSDEGKVRSLDREVLHPTGSLRKLKGKTLKALKDKAGYETAMLSKEGKQTMFKIHRLVAMSFLPNPENLPEVHHKDECKFNNSEDNLEWISSEDHRSLTHSKNYKFISPNKKVFEIFNLSRFCRENNLTAQNMSSVHSGKLKAHKGWTKS